MPYIATKTKKNRPQKNKIEESNQFFTGCTYHVNTTREETVRKY